MAVYNYNTLDMYYQKSGSGDTCLLFLHGLGGNGAVWKYQLEYFQDRYETITVDLFGHGHSSKGVNPALAPRINAEAIDSFFRYTVNKPFIAVGHSLAGCVLQEIIRLNTPGLKGAVFVDSTYLGLRNIINMHIDFSRRMLEWPDDRLKDKTDTFFDSLIGDNVSEEGRVLIKSSLDKCYPRWLFEYAVGCGEYNINNPPEKIPIDKNLPILIVEAGHGVGSNFAKSWINLFRQSDYYLFEESFHYLFISNPERFNKLLEDFITGIK